jgi:hypothetical protein
VAYGQVFLYSCHWSTSILLIFRTWNNEHNCRIIRLIFEHFAASSSNNCPKRIRGLWQIFFHMNSTPLVSRAKNKLCSGYTLILRWAKCEKLKRKLNRYEALYYVLGWLLWWSIKWKSNIKHFVVFEERILWLQKIIVLSTVVHI